jgi:hypothetical protein
MLLDGRALLDSRYDAMDRAPIFDRPAGTGRFHSPAHLRGGDILRIAIVSWE